MNKNDYTSNMARLVFMASLKPVYEDELSEHARHNEVHS